jgi:hypothetical protein
MTDSDDLGRRPGDDERDEGSATARAAGIADRAGEAGHRAAALARSGYEAASGQVSASPFASLVVTLLVGVGVGWALRGAHEEDRRTRWMAALPDPLRRRLR